MTPNAVSVQLPIQTTVGSQNLELASGSPTFIVGGNGTGKSALVHMLAIALRSRGLPLTYLPGSRPSYFEADSLNMTPATRQSYETNSPGWDMSPDTRVRPISGTSRNERAIFDLQAAEIQYKVDAANDIQTNGAAATSIQRLALKNAPLDRINRILKEANLPVQMVISGAEIKAERNNTIYSISKMSDGERTAVILLADIIAAKPGSVILIDEPELHMHPSIIVPLIKAAIVSRADCTFLVCTHELSLPKAMVGATIVIVRACTWIGGGVQNWDITLLPGTTGIPEDIREEIIGARQKMLFVEGKDVSLDRPLYALLFPKISVSSRETCIEVRRVVEGIRFTETSHNVKAYGIVDNDSMTSDFAQKLRNAGVFPLSMFSVESLYYSSEVINAVAERQATTLGLKREDLIANAKIASLESLKPSNIQHIAARVAERYVRDALLANMPSREDIIAGNEKVQVSLVHSYPQKITEIQTLLNNGDLDALISKFPVRETGMLDKIAKGLRLPTTLDYEQAALAAINASDALRHSLRAKLGDLAIELA